MEPTDLKLPEGRVAFAQFLFEPTRDETRGRDYYWCKIAIPKDSIPKGSEGMNRILAARQAALSRVFKNGKLPPGGWDVLRDGDKMESVDGEPIEEFRGHWVVKVKTFRVPVVLRKSGGIYTPLPQAAVKSGDWLIAAGGCYAYSNVQNGVSFGADKFLFVRSGKPFAGSGGIDSDDVFADEEDSQLGNEAFAEQSSGGAQNQDDSFGKMDDEIPF